MIDWVGLLNEFIYWAQWATTLVFLALIGIAAIGFFVSKRITLSCIVIAIALFIVALIVEDQFGIPLLAPEFLNFFQDIFH